jgi:hypothetical protein
MRGDRRRVLVWWSLSVLAPAAAIRAAERADASPPKYAIHIADTNTAAALQHVLDGAWKRLGGKRCQALFSEFTDGSGRPLQAVLDGLGHSAQSYLGLIIFYDGASEPWCSRNWTLALTTPGGRAVRVCPAQLRKKAERNDPEAEAVLIHEALHTLGLGENPPSSWEITKRVRELCPR